MPKTSALSEELNRVHLNKGPVPIDGFHHTGEIPRTCDFEKPAAHFFLDRKGKLPDIISDDQGLFIKTTKDLVIFLDCCHAGLINTLTHIRAVSGE